MEKLEKRARSLGVEGERVKKVGRRSARHAHNWHQVERRERSFWEQGV